MSERFLGLCLRPVDPARPEPLASLLAAHPQPLSGFTLATLVAWDAVFGYGWAQPAPDLLVVACRVAPDPHRHLLQPVGALTPDDADRLVAGIARLDYPLRVFGCSESFLVAHPGFVARFSVADEPAAANYLHAASDLADLPGKRFSAKRNLIAQATRLNPWTVEPIGPGHAPDLRAVCEAVAAEAGLATGPTERHERIALKRTLEHLAGLRQRGVLVRVEGHPVAFTLWETLQPGTAVVHFERALRRHRGLYQVVNREAARRVVAEGLTLINREEDLGDPGLRQAKRSYHPVRMERSFTLTFRA